MRKFNFYNSSVTASRATSLDTREAFFCRRSLPTVFIADVIHKKVSALEKLTLFHPVEFYGCFSVGFLLLLHKNLNEKQLFFVSWLYLLSFRGNV